MTPHVVLNDYPHRLTKNEGKWISKIPIFKHFSELAKIWKCSLASSKFQFSTSFMNLEKLGYTAQDQHLRIQILNLWMIGKIYVLMFGQKAQKIYISSLCI